MSKESMESMESMEEATRRKTIPKPKFPRPKYVKAELIV